MRRTKLQLPRQRKCSWFQTYALPVVACLVMSGCAVSTMRRDAESPVAGAPSVEALGEAPESAAFAVRAVSPPRFLRPDGRDLSLEALQGLFKSYDYIIVDGDPRSVVQRELQLALLTGARAALREGGQQGLRHTSLPPREPALALEALSVESNPEPSLNVPDSPAALRGDTREAEAYRALLDAAGQGDPLPVRGLSLPARVTREAAIGAASVAPADRHFLPPLILPMPEDDERLEDSSPVAMLVPASGSSETVVLRDPGPVSGNVAAINLRNSAMAWHAARIAHEDVERPLFIVLKQAGFDRGEGLGEAIAYFDASARVLQIVVAEGRPDSVKTEDGRALKALIPAKPLPSVGRKGVAKADYVFALVQPDTRPDARP